MAETRNAGTVGAGSTASGKDDAQSQKGPAAHAAAGSGDVPVGTAGPALAAHSKDAAAPGQTAASGARDTHPVSSAVGGSSAASPASGAVDPGHGSPAQPQSEGLSGQVSQAAERAGATLSEAAGKAREAIAGQGGQAADQVAALVREQPLTALAVTGLVGLAIGILIGRR
jgi:ElaB/YqjD/DUF883 family membrane-anchored ribosome-binding protein